jgi:pimeloyl-ACP methyl ester carboxylesterase
LGLRQSFRRLPQFRGRGRQYRHDLGDGELTAWHGGRDATVAGMESMSVTLPDGRLLDVLAGSAGAGNQGLVFHHGTPGNAPRYETWFPSVEARGLRPIAFSRPGYASSTRLRGRRVASVVDDIVSLLDELGIGEFYSLGGSGGGPHTIACAALLPDRCLGSAALVTIAPWQAEGLDYYAGMARTNIEEFDAALAGEASLREWMATEGEEFRTITGPQMVAALGDALPPVDQSIATGEWADREAAGMRRALEHGFDGWVDDDLAFVQPWGFAVEDIRVPVQIWQGEVDRLVPWAHGQWLAERIPGAQFTLAEGQGHFSLGVNSRDEILDRLLSR